MSSRKQRPYTGTTIVPLIDRESRIMHVMVKRGLYEPLFPELFEDKQKPFGTFEADEKLNAYIESRRVREERIADYLRTVYEPSPTLEDAIALGFYQPLFRREGKPYDQELDDGVDIEEITSAVSQSERDQVGSVDSFTIAQVANDQNIVPSAQIDPKILKISVA
jgi:hypothetical protein